MLIKSNVSAHYANHYDFINLHVTPIKILMQRNKRDFVGFLVLEVFAMLITGIVAITSITLSSKASLIPTWLTFSSERASLCRNFK